MFSFLFSNFSFSPFGRAHWALKQRPRVQNAKQTSICPPLKHVIQLSLSITMVTSGAHTVHGTRPRDPSVNLSRMLTGWATWQCNFLFLNCGWISPYHSFREHSSTLMLMKGWAKVKCLKNVYHYNNNNDPDDDAAASSSDDDNTFINC